MPSFAAESSELGARRTSSEERPGLALRLHDCAGPRMIASMDLQLVKSDGAPARPRLPTAPGAGGARAGTGKRSPRLSPQPSGRTRIEALYQAGSLKLRFPRARAGAPLEAVLLNIARRRHRRRPSRLCGERQRACGGGRHVPGRRAHLPPVGRRRLDSDRAHGRRRGRRSTGCPRRRSSSTAPRFPAACRPRSTGRAACSPSRRSCSAAPPWARRCGT